MSKPVGGDIMYGKLFFWLWSMAIIPPIDTVHGQHATAVRRIGWFALTAQSTNPARFEAFRQGLRDLGYIEGQNLVIERVDAGGKQDKLPEAAAELVRRNVEVIVTTGSTQVFAAKQATRTIPIVMTTGADPVALGLVASLARPGGNVTGLTSISNDLAAKRVELLKETIPKLSQIGLLWNPDDPGSGAALKESEGAAKAYGMQFHSLEMRRAGDLDAAFKMIGSKRVGALVISQTGVINDQRLRIIEFATKQRSATMFGDSERVDAGGLMSYAPYSPDQYRRAATYVDKLLKGTKPADLPVEQPKKFEFVVNLKTAKQIGQNIPPDVLARATRIIR